MIKLILCGLFIVAIIIRAHDIKGFDDSILYDISWPGSSLENLDQTSDHIIVSSSHKEKFACYLPKVYEKETKSEEPYDGPTPLELISPFFHSKLPCSYRQETYWSYELCHGRYVRQYHEDREGKTFKLQDFTLGRWDKAQHEKRMQELIEEQNANKNLDIPTKKIDGVNLPYFEIVMGNGTLCDLNNNKPRQTSVIYVCYIHGKNEIYSRKETSICQYEIIVLTPLLCPHPKFKPKETGENKINCLSVDDNAKKPYNLVKLKEESRKMKQSAELEHIRLEFLPIDISDKQESVVPETPVDTSPIESFLAGKNCLNGGTGWWKYEFCYGKSVEQYHIERDGSKTSINLGIFDKSKHLEWINMNPHKRPKPLAQRTQLSHLYSSGSVCDKTGKARQTEVKLKCMENASSLNKVSLYLLEPRYCEYILGVQSPLICDILARADETGLVEAKEDDMIRTEEISINIRV